MMMVQVVLLRETAMWVQVLSGIVPLPVIHVPPMNMPATVFLRPTIKRPELLSYCEKI